MKPIDWTDEQASSSRSRRVRRNQGADQYQLDPDCNEAPRRAGGCFGSQPQRANRTLCAGVDQPGGQNLGGILRQLISQSEHQLAKIEAQIAQLDQERQQLAQEQQEALQAQRQLQELLEQFQQSIQAE
jgi:hypothetical protein